MKKCIFFLVFLISVAVYAQEVIDNPSMPKNDKAGRVLELREELRIDGEGEGYYYNGANGLRVDNSGNIYIRDSWSSGQRSHLLKFSPEGKFLLDLYRQGEGPGEIQSGFDFALSVSEVFLYDWMKRKAVVMSQDGKFREEFKTESGWMRDFIDVFEDWLVFWRRENPSERKTSGLYDVKNVIVFVSKDGQIKKDVFAFCNQQFFVSLTQGGGGMGWDPFTIAIGDSKLYVCHSSEYLINVLDLNTGEITDKFKRKYPRVKHEQKKWEKDFISKFNAPKKRFEHDVKDLFYDRGRLWVKTSKEEEKKGSLFDLFDSKGRFLDSFYINIKGRILKIDGEYLYAGESDKDELPLVVKYRIVDSAIRNQSD